MPTFPDCPAFPAETELLRTTSPLVEGPFKTSATDTQALFFSSAYNEEVGGIGVVAENDISPMFVKDMIAFIDSNTNGIYDVEEKILFRYTIKLFISRDDSYLRQAFDKTSPLPDEVCLFLEDNSNDFMSDRSAYIKIGSNFQSDLRKKQIAEIESKNLLHLNFLQSSTEYKLDFTADEINTLIRTGQLENKTQTLFLSILQVLSIGNVLLAPFFASLGKGILWITRTMRGRIQFQEYHWDPQAKNPHASDSENERFSPVLFGFLTSPLHELNELAEETVSSVSNATKDALRNKVREFRLQAGTLQHAPLAGYAMPQGIADFVDTCFQMIDKLINNLIANCESMVKLFMGFGERWFNALNAFYCGLWNGLIEAVLGLVDLVGYFFSVLGFSDDMAYAQARIPEALELLDEAIQTILTVDIPGMLSAAINAIGESIRNFNLYALTGTINLERVAYFVGGLVGFAVEIVIGIFWSGGIDSVRATLLKFGKVGEDIFQFMEMSVKQLLGTAFQFTLNNTMALMRSILALLKKGKEEVEKMIYAIFKALEDAAELADDLIQKIIRQLQLTNEEVKYIDELGLKFVKVKNDVSTLCMVSAR